MKKAKKRAHVRKASAKKRKPTAAQLAYYARNKTASGRRKYAGSDEKKRQTLLGHTTANAEALTGDLNVATEAQPQTLGGVGLGMPIEWGNITYSVSTASAVQEGDKKYITLTHGAASMRLEATDSLIFKLGMDCLKLVPAPRT